MNDFKVSEFDLKDLDTIIERQQKKDKEYQMRAIEIGPSVTRAYEKMCEILSKKYSYDEIDSVIENQYPQFDLNALNSGSFKEEAFKYWDEI